MLVEQRLVDAVGDAALPRPDKIVRPVRACASTAAVGVVVTGTGVQPGKTVFFHVFFDERNYENDNGAKYWARREKEKRRKRKRRESL